MFRLRAVLATLLLAAPFTASAAEITRLASSFDEDDPFDLFIDVGFSRTQNRSKIVREQVTSAADGGTRDVNELWFRGVDSRLNIDLSLGLYRDLQFTFSVPLVLQQNDSYDFVAGTNEGNSTIVNNCVNPDGSLTNPNCLTTGAGKRALFTVGSGVTSRRGGLGNMRFGLAYGFFNQKEDPSKPDWVVGIDYEAPTASQRDPSVDNTLDDSDRGNVGDRVHKYTFYTALSRRIGKADPYFKAYYTLPVTGPGIYSNCFNRTVNTTGGFESPTLGRPDNCFAPNTPWNRKETGIQAPHMAGFVTGSEFLAFDDKTKKQQLALDVRALGNYVGRGRYYNELSSVMGKLLATQDYFQVGGLLGVTASAGNAFKLRASGTFLYNTDHTLTDEVIGKDLDDNNGVDIETNPSEINPNFDFRTDLVSRRFRATEGKMIRLDVMATFMF
jgi:hypothetical protein